MKSLQLRNHSKRNLIIALAVVLLAGLASGYYYYAQSHQDKAKDTSRQTTSNNKKDSSEPATDQEKQAGATQKQQTIDNDQTSNQAKSLEVTITAANQYQNTLSVRALISTVSSNGTCKLTLTKGSVAVTKTAGLQALAESSTCKGFDVPTSELSPGTWHISLSATIGSMQGQDQKDIVVN